ncbi:GT-D fold domain-containing glycosyltransferase [Clostridium sp. D53t1_180928_C8]|uniref:GT-D fold domain-containing glycosyltransferase n=1 Tax=Clostridium sp. D53t1_180928_C8 TaxID=2787101 RepID=UPI0018A8CD6F|nr:GT-D fold domain-containing glycosyltransferase [Clostridium sp. D53t1_180928_C8]
MKLKTYMVYTYNRFLKYFINLNILNNDKSINEIVTTNKSLVRYGDGEMSIILGGYINFQKYDAQLAQRLKEILMSDDNNIIIGIPVAIKNTKGYNKKATDFWNQNMDTGRMHWNKLCNSKKIYCNASMTRLFIDYEDKDNSIRWFNRFKDIWSNKDILLIEGKESKLGINNDLFNNSNSIDRIIAPSKDAYDRYEEILESIIKHCKNKLVLLSLGPTATILAYDLAKKGIRALDIGHIQLEYNEFIKYAKKNKLLNDNIKCLTNEEYKSQIIYEFN